MDNMEIIKKYNLKGYQPYVKCSGAYKILQVIPCNRKIDVVVTYKDGREQEQASLPVVAFALYNSVTRDGCKLQHMVPLIMDGGEVSGIEGEYDSNLEQEVEFVTRD